ncbi:flagellar hook assembly protein FlgD [Acetobacter estunensis]|uniref:flagellar hook assembly protein FlgD n=1 Tax=Acetobacter estunensis TaxID=104097 RepID=UPI001C2D4B28|nr:flagellar hook capping FlgD N-terminal domain-containing protein [Acetobacter estunensis]MBV1836140.1 flagellar biosynthesis protein FlgD [Acetobacter estunensis]
MVSSTTSTSSTTSLLSATVTAARSATATNVATNTSSTTSDDTDTTDSNALSSLASNYTTFLTLLTTQLKNQDPSSPMSSDSFTTELAQFAGVEQQVATNTNLKTLISLTEDGQQSSNMSLVGKTATATTSELPLQNGSSQISFTTTSAEPIAIAVTDSSGNVVQTAEYTSTVGTNTWTWNGTDTSGNQLSDGSYNIAVETADSSGNTSAVPFQVTGSVTGVTRDGTTLYVEMGASKIDMSDVTSFSDASSSSSSSSSSATSSGSTSS